MTLIYCCFTICLVMFVTIPKLLRHVKKRKMRFYKKANTETYFRAISNNIPALLEAMKQVTASK